MHSNDAYMLQKFLSFISTHPRRDLFKFSSRWTTLCSTTSYETITLEEKFYKLNPFTFYIPSGYEWLYTKRSFMSFQLWSLHETLYQFKFVDSIQNQTWWCWLDSVFMSFELWKEKDLTSLSRQNVFRFSISLHPERMNKSLRMWLLCKAEVAIKVWWSFRFDVPRCHIVINEFLFTGESWFIFFNFQLHICRRI